MGIKIFDKHKLEKKLKEAEIVAEKLREETKSQEEKIKSNCMKIGSLVIEKNIQINNAEITQLRNDVIKAKSKLQELQDKKRIANKDVYDIEESLRNLDGKMSCPKCGQIYEKKDDLLFCSKCGGSLKIKMNQKNN